MAWQDAEFLIRQNIFIGIDLNTSHSTKREVISTPPHYVCDRYDYNGEEGYKVKIGTLDTIEIPISMLKKCYASSIGQNGYYSRDIFKALFTRQANAKGCHIHVVGKIFEMSRVANGETALGYQIVV